MFDTPVFSGARPGNSRARDLSHRKLAAWLFVTIIALALQGCGNITSTVTDIKPLGAGTTAPDTLRGGTILMDGQLYQAMSFQVSGSGICKRMFINFGDFTPPLEVTNVDLSSNPTVTHTYNGWNGRKNVWAYGNWADGCDGSVKHVIMVGPQVMKLGYKPVPIACVPYPGKPILRKNTVVVISDFTLRSGPESEQIRIEFGCNGACRYSAFGLQTPAPSPEPGFTGYPFPGLRELSLVVRVGTIPYQAANTPNGQGGISNFTFTTTEPGLLEICVNDYKLDDNQGEWGIGVTIDESAAE